MLGELGRKRISLVFSPQDDQLNQIQEPVVNSFITQVTMSNLGVTIGNYTPNSSKKEVHFWKQAFIAYVNQKVAILDGAEKISALAQIIIIKIVM